MYNNLIDYSKRGVIVIGSPRSGSHVACDMLYHQATCNNTLNLGEIYCKPGQDINYINRASTNLFIFCSIVRLNAKSILAADLSVLDDYQLINIRRRNKVSQYISTCVMRSQINSNVLNHTPNWSDCKDHLPWKSTKDDLMEFIINQNSDFAFKFDHILYYEDLVDSGLYTDIRKNEYPITHEKIVTDYNLVKEMLEGYNYGNR